MTSRRKIPKKYFLKACTLIDKKSVPRWDFHIHSNYSDGKASIPEIFEVAIREKCEVIIFTEHTEPWRFENEKWYLEYYREIEKHRKVNADRIRAFIGIESNAVSFNGELDATEEMLNTAELVLGAAHRYPEIGDRRVQDLSASEAIDLEYRTLCGLAQSIEVDALAHVGATCSKYCAPFPLHLVREIISLAVRNEVAIEINPAYHQPLIPFLEMCAEEGALVTLGSNAHGYGDIGMIYRELNKAFGA